MRDGAASHKEQIAGVFGRAAPTYDRDGNQRFAYFGRRLVAAAGLAAGARVLDVAAGRGAVLFAAAEQVGPHGHVVGIDLSGPMVESTAADIAGRGLTQAAIHCMDAEHLDFPPASFDHVLCGFGIMFFPDLDHALGEIRRVLRPGGALLASTWGQRDPRWTISQGIQRDYGVSEGLMVNPLNQPAQVEAALRRAGFDPVEVWTDEAEFTYASEDEWWESLWSTGLRHRLERLDKETLARFQAEAFQHLRERREPSGLPERRQAILAKGVNPAGAITANV